jgi:hypothetical protein
VTIAQRANAFNNGLATTEDLLKQLLGVLAW